MDVAAAAADTADEEDGDLSVREVDVDASRPDSRSASPTPPPAPASQLRLVDVIAERTARGEEPPGIADGDQLMEGRKASDEEDNVQAEASESRRRAKPGGTGRRQSRKSDADTEPDSDAAVKAPRAGKLRKRARSPSPQASDSADSADHRSTSRHRPVSNSAIYNAYASEGQIFADVRRRFQTLIYARDGSPLKTLTVHCPLKLTLQAAKDVMDTRMYKDFKNAMELAYKGTSKE